MAIINFYDDILGSVKETKEVKGGKTLREYIDEYFAEKGEDYEVVESYNLKTGKTEYKTVQIDNYKVISLVNNEEKPFDVVAQENDIVQIVFIPESSSWSTPMKVIGGLLGIVGGVVTFFNPAIGLGISAIGAFIYFIGSSLEGHSNSSGETQALEAENSLSLHGGSNESIVGKRYPFIMGKHLINPFIVGTGYNTTYVKDMTGKDAGQYLSGLYCIGYAPLKITDIKIGDVIAAYNREVDNNGVKTVMHGRLKQFVNTETDNGEILRKWKNNDLSFEILQKGKLALSTEGTKSAQMTDMYGTIYPQKVAQLEVSANLLNIKDGLIADQAQRVYKGVSVPNGFQSNSVRFSESCPRKLEVELDFPNGLYANRSKGSNIYYYNLPVRLAVQWRFVKDGQNSSDALDPIGWNNFDYILTNEDDCKTKNVPQPYTLAKKMFDYNSSYGKTDYFDENDIDDIDDFVYNDNWIQNGVRLFEFGCENEPDVVKNTKTYAYCNYSVSQFLSIQKIIDSENYYIDSDLTTLFSNTVKGNYTVKYFATVEPWSYVSGTSTKYYSTIQDDIEISQAVYEDFLATYTDGIATEDYYALAINNKNKNDYIPTYVSCDETGEISAAGTVDNNDDVRFNLRNVYIKLYKNGNSENSCLYKKWSDLSSSSSLSSELLFPWGYCQYKIDSYMSCDETVHESASNTSEFQWVKLTDEEYNKWLAIHSTSQTATTKDPLDANFDGILINREGVTLAVTKVKKLTIEDAERAKKVIADVKTTNKDLTCQRYKPTEFKNVSGVHERRYVIVKEFTEEECRQMVNFNTDSQVSLDSIEVRVLRITPSYFEEIQDSTSSSSYTAMTYQDLAKWTYLRSYCFDKEEYLAALKEAKAKDDAVDTTAGKVNLAAVSVDDYPQRPQSQSDMDKFCYLAVSLKQDVAETGGSSLNAISCIAQSFAPKYNDDLESNKWRPSPNEIKAKYKYFKIETDADGEKKYTEVEESEYNEATDKSSYKKALAGNNYLDFIKEQKIFNDTDNAPQLYYKQSPYNEETYSNEEEQVYPEPFAKYFLNSYTESHYISNNTASIFALALLGPQLGKEAKTYNDINLNSLTEAYKFCEDLTDGTPDEDSEDGLKHFKLTCNGIITNEVKLETLCENILATGRCSLKRDDENKYEIVIGRKQDYPVMLLNQKNCLSKTNSRSFNDIPSGFQINFVDESDNYTSNDIYIMNDGEDYKNPSDEIESLSLQYVTNREQVWTLGRFNLGCRIYQRETYSRKVGRAGYLLSFGDMVLLQDETLVVGTDKGARIKQIIYDDNNDPYGKNHKYIYGIITDEPFESTGKIVDGKNPQGVTIMQAAKSGRSRCVTIRLNKAGYSFTNGSGEFVLNKGLTNVILFSNRIALKEEYIEDELETGIDAETSDYVMVQPQVDDVVAFGLVEDITIKAIITGIKPGTKEQFDLTLVPYNEGLYTLGKKMIEFKSRMTQPAREATEVEFVDEITQTTINTTVAKQTSYLDEQLKTITQKIENTTETPEITVTPTNIGIAVNDESITTKTQTFEVAFSVAQFGDELDFDFNTTEFKYCVNNETDENGSPVYTALELTGTTDSEGNLLPITYKLSGKKVLITIQKGTKIVTDSFVLPITYRPLLISSAYSSDPQTQSIIDREIANIDKTNTDLTEEERSAKIEAIIKAYNGSKIYGNGTDNTVYGVRKLSSIIDTHTETITAIAVEGGRYLGGIIEVNKDYIVPAESYVETDSNGNKNSGWKKTGNTILVSSLVMGDYMTFVGTDKTASSFVRENGTGENKGQYFFTNNQYEFQGVPSDSSDTIMWEWSSISEHIGGELTDALASCNESLKMNNSQVVQFLDHLTANSIFVDKLVANQAFIKQLTANKIVVDAITDPGSTAGSAALGVTGLQKIYYLSDKTTTPAAPTDYVTSSATTVKTWTTVIPPFSGNYKYLFVCTQYKSEESDSVNCTTVTRDTETESSLQAIFNAATAQSSANNAQTSANNAQSAADKAQTSANNAQTTANTATNAKRVIKVENLYYLSQINGENSSPSVPVINNNCPISDEILESEGWSTVYPNLKYDYDFVSCDTGSMSAVYTCQRLTVIQNGVQSYEFTAVTRDHTSERLYAMTNGRTIIEGGYIKTDLLDVNKIFAKQIKLQNTQNGDTTVYGSIYGGERYNADGTDNDTTSKGFYLGADGTLKAKDGYFEGEINATSGILNSVKATNLTVETGTFNNVNVNGFYISNYTPFQPIAMINIGYNNNAIQLTNSKNVKSVVRSEKGVYTVYFNKSVKLKTHIYNSNKYIDVFAIGNASDSFEKGFTNPILCNPNWLRKYVDERLTVDYNNYAEVTYVTLYFADNNSDSMQDPVSAQYFIFGTESD